MKLLSFLCCIIFPFYVVAQKAPLDHSVYDGWQSIGERMISNDGKWIVYSVTPQEGDAVLMILSALDTAQKMEVPRGYNASISNDSRYVVFRIKPTYKETREAKIKKKKAEEMPKDTLGIVQLGTKEIVKWARVKSFKTPEKTAGWVAIQKEKEPSKPGTVATIKTVDSLKKTIDSLLLLVTDLKNVKAGKGDSWDAEDDPALAGASAEGSDLILRNLIKGKDRVFKNVGEYYFNTYGQKLVMRITRNAKDSSSVNGVVVYDLLKSKPDTIIKGGNDFRNIAISEAGDKIAFVGDRDTTTNALQKFYGLYLYQSGGDSANLLLDKNTPGMRLGMTVSEHGVVNFSKSGNRLFFGTVPIPSPKDTSLIDIDLVKLDIWNYKDDYLQTQQLLRLPTELKKSFLGVYDFTSQKIQQLANEGLPTVLPTNDGDGDQFVAITDTGRRVETQWLGGGKRDIYSLDLHSGRTTLIKKNLDGNVFTSSTGKYILLYDNKARNYFSWNGKALKNITASIPVPLYNEENDVPDEPNAYGVMGWHQGDSAVYIYDRYDVWKVDPAANRKPVNITASGRKTRNSYRYVKLNEDEKFFILKQPLYFKVQNQVTKQTGYAYGSLGNTLNLHVIGYGKYNFNTLAKANEASTLLYSKENFSQSPDLYLLPPVDVKRNEDLFSDSNSIQISFLNPQQASFNWGTAELYKWKTFDGKPGTGILYKPEDFDATKKYPVIFYFYEKLSDGLYNYSAPAPTPSRLNIPFFVSRGYLVVAPDISYTKGHPGKDAYNYIVSAAKSLSNQPWVDGKNMAIQGQSWGGYQVAYLITATNLFKAAWAGAPVVNMFSAYGGIRWESGNNRQSQYEKGQSRIGSTPWERPDLYMENSPFFHLKKVNTPLVIMANDADGAVPWYQGIEFFTAMRRLGKKVWLLNYNGEAHNLVERKNRKDIQVREQQYFDWLLKGQPAPQWITEGVPATKKGKEWGLGTGIF